MSDTKHEQPLTDKELSELTQKLKHLGNSLSPKEGWFLNEALKSGIVKNKVGSVQGATMQSALEPNQKVYYPDSYTNQFGPGKALSPAEADVGVFVVVHF